MSMKISCLSIAAVLAATSLAWAQVQPTAQDQPRRAQPARSADEKGNTEELAGWLAMGNHSEIVLAKLAMEKSKTPAVRQFAQKMVEDHSAQLKKLQTFIPDINLDETIGDGTTGEPRPTRRPDDRPVDRVREPRAGEEREPRGEELRADEPRRAAEQAHGTLMTVGLRACKIKLAMTRNLLDQYEGQDFDMGYLGQQIVAHTGMLATLHAMKNEGSPEFQQVVAEGITTTEGHLQMAQRLAHAFEDQERTGTERESPRRTDEPRLENDREAPAPRTPPTRQER